MNTPTENAIDWKAFRRALGDVPTFDNPKILKAKSRDFFWYSPILARKLDGCIADLVVRPRTQEELVQVLKHAYANRVPVTLRGRGSGNYGQAVPLEGGLVVEMTGLDRVLEIGEDFVRVEAGCNLHRLNEALRAHGKELPIFSSTQRIATIGGFVGGGSCGIGSIEHGMLQDYGNIIRITALSLEAEPVRHEFTGEDVNLLHHAWGINGVITELTMKTAPERDWINCISSFPTYRAAFDAGTALGHRRDLRRKLVCTVDAGFTPYFAKLEGRVEVGRHLMLTLIDRGDVPAFERLVQECGGTTDLCLDETEMAAEGLPHVFEFSFNHTTLQVLNVDPSVTYLQVRVPAPIDARRVDAVREILGDEILMHHEFFRLNDELVAGDLPVVFYTTDERLYEIIRIYEDHGCPVSDPHTFIIEDGGMKHADYRHLSWKKRLDPRGLLNPGKSKEWPRVRHLDPAAIEALHPGAQPGAG